MRSTPGALVAYIAVILVLPVLFGNVLGTLGQARRPVHAEQAGGSFSNSIREPHTLTPWTGLGVLAAWAVLATVVATIELRRRDA